MKTNYASMLDALTKAGLSSDKARDVLISQGITLPSPSIASMVKSASNETVLRWFRVYLSEAVKPENDAKLGYYLSKLNRHFAVKGKKYGKNDFATDVMNGEDVNASLAKVGTWIIKPEPTDAELLLAWSFALASGNSLLIERVARKASTFAPVNPEKPISLDGFESPITLTE
jgi:hypothetical protein